MDLRHSIATSRMSGYQWLVVSLAFLLNMLDGFDVLSLAFTAKSIAAELSLNGKQIGFLLSAGLFGMAIGSIGLSPLADKFGRRPLLLAATAISALGMLLTYFSHSVNAIAVSRVITGIGVGGILTCTNVLSSEYANNKWRNVAIAYYAAGFGIGAMLGGMSAIMLQDHYGWRAVFLTGAVLSFLALVLLFFILPESVDFLMSKRPPQALAKLHKIAQKMGLSGDWQLPEANLGKQKVSVLRLFEPDYLRNTLLIWLAFIAISAAFYFISSWTPALLESAGMPKTQSQSMGMAISIGGTIGSFLFGFVASRFSARQMLMSFAIASAIAVSAFVFSKILVLSLILAVLIGGLINGCITGLYTINPSLYAPEFRSTGVGTAIGIGRIGSIVSPMLAGELLDRGWEKGNLYLGAAFILLLAATAIFFIQNHRKDK